MTENKFDSANGFMLIEISIYLAFKYLTEKNWLCTDANYLYIQ